MKTMFLLLVIVMLGLGTVPAEGAEEGFEDGRNWAAANDVSDSDFHGSKSEDFNNGVRQYALQQQEQQLEDDDDIESDN